MLTGSGYLAATENLTKNRETYLRPIRETTGRVISPVTSNSHEPPCGDASLPAACPRCEGSRASKSDEIDETPDIKNGLHIPGSRICVHNMHIYIYICTLSKYFFSYRYIYAHMQKDPPSTRNPIGNRNTFVRSCGCMSTDIGAPSMSKTDFELDSGASEGSGILILSTWRIRITSTPNYPLR